MKLIKGFIIYLRLHFHRSFYSKRRIQKYQLRQLQKLYKFAINNSEFYRDLYTGYTFKSIDDFYELPVINKKIMMDHFTELNTCGINKEEVMDYIVEKENNKDYLGYYKDQYVVGLSSGTSGNKGIYITDKKMTELLPFVFLARGGFSLKLLPFNILFMLRVFSQGFEDINSRRISLKYLSTMTSPKVIVDTLNQNNINILMAPPSLIRQLLPFVGDINVQLKKIMTYAEVLEEEDKIRFEQEFHTEVIEIYQASEGQIASACKYGHLHINEDLVFVELYDEIGNIIIEPNKVGHKMILTNLVNYAQPLIRYEMNDMIVLDEQCECGSHFRRIKKIYGRHDDLLYFTDSKNQKKYIFPDLFVRWIIVSSESIKEFQVIQNELNCVDIYIDLIDNVDNEVIPIIQNKIMNELETFDISNVTVNVVLKTLELPKDKNKYKRFINNID